MAFSVKGSYSIAKVPLTANKARLKVHGASRSNPKVPDEIVLAMRRMHEVERKPFKDVFAAFPQYTKNYIVAILSYTLRAHLKS